MNKNRNIFCKTPRRFLGYKNFRIFSAQYLLDENKYIENTFKYIENTFKYIPPIS